MSWGSLSDKNCLTKKVNKQPKDVKLHNVKDYYFYIITYFSTKF